MDLSDEERRTLRELERDDLVTVRHGRISFKHDLLGDWARLHALLAAGTNAGEKIKEGSRFPRWQRAIRLYAQNLLEHEGGAQRWKEAISEFQSEDGNAVMAADYYLDALIFSGNAAALLEQLWPDLLGDKGRMLRRLLKRFLYIHPSQTRAQKRLLRPETWIGSQHASAFRSYFTGMPLSECSNSIAVMFPDSRCSWEPRSVNLASNNS